mgnify:CR=1 FL=1
MKCGQLCCRYRSLASALTGFGHITDAYLATLRSTQIGSLRSPTSDMHQPLSEIAFELGR